MRFELTEKHIAKGVAGHCSSCPIALCMSEQLGGLVIVGYDDVEYDDHDFSLPAEARDFIWNFDHGLSVKPFSFSIPNLERIMQ